MQKIINVSRLQNAVSVIYELIYHLQIFWHLNCCYHDFQFFFIKLWFLGKIGGDSDLSERGWAYARPLGEFVKTQRIHDLKVCKNVL